MQILDKGDLTLLGFMGGDISVVAAARVSNGIDINAASRGEEKDAKLINYLMKHKHWTPFEHSVFKFYVKCPLFVAREWHRHRAASYNEISGRYVKFIPEFYVPDHARIPAETNKQGSVFAKEGGILDRRVPSVILSQSQAAFRTYEDLLEMGVAKEMARMVLPLNLYTQFIFTVNARNLINFISLRNSADAQWEIRQYAQAIEGNLNKVMPLSYSAYLEHYVG